MIRFPVRFSESHEISDTLLRWVSLYLLPCAAAIVTLWALLAWQPAYELGGARPLEFRVLEQAAEQVWQVDQAASNLAGQPLLPAIETRRSENPFWAEFLAVPGGAEPEILVFPSRHIRRLSCWQADTLALLGSASRSTSSQALRPVLGGFGLEGARGRILCRFEFVGPAQLTIQSWAKQNLSDAQRKFERNSGLIEGGPAILAAMAILVAIVNRDGLYLLFAAWLLVNIRMAGLSAGWDTQIFERLVPVEWVYNLRALTMAAYYTLTAAIFSRMFRDELSQGSERHALQLAQWLSFLLLALAIILPYRIFLPVIWLATACGIAIVLVLLWRLLQRNRSWMAIWYGGALAVTMAASLYEVVAAAFGFRDWIGSINSVTAAVVSSLMATLAIAEHMKREHQGRLDAQAELQHTYDVIPIGLFTLESDGRFHKHNPALAAMLGTGGGILRWQEYFGDFGWQALLQAMACGQAELELEGAAEKNGCKRRFLVQAASFETRIEGSLQDISERYRAHEALRYLSEFDALTEVRNRRAIELLAEQALACCSLSRPLAVAYLDLDRFKLINDLFGHTVGDDILQQVCRRIEGELAGRPLGRIGGDEFLVLFENMPLESAMRCCRSLVHEIEGSLFESWGKAFRVKISVGLVEVLGQRGIKEVISVADRACRAAKRKDSGVHVLAANSQVMLEHAWELDLIRRFDVDRPPEGLFLEMQPILSLRNPADSLNFEVLLRLREPDGRVVLAGAIIAAAENSGRIAVIDRWVLTTTLNWLETHQAQLASTRFVSVNLSGASLSDEAFVREAFALLEACPAARDRLCLEVTESVALRDIGNTRIFFENARRAGVRVALDDFGAGYTSFSYLKALPADALKIDGSFVIDAARNPASLTIIEAVAKLAHNFGMRTIAEWAEDLPTLAVLVEAGIDYVQGYVISRSVSPERILAARSTIDLIDDPAVADYVRNTLGNERPAEEVGSPTLH